MAEWELAKRSYQHLFPLQVFGLVLVGFRKTPHHETLFLTSHQNTGLSSYVHGCICTLLVSRSMLLLFLSHMTLCRYTITHFNDSGVVSIIPW